MIEFYTRGNTRFISSYQLYQVLRLPEKYRYDGYYRDWIQRAVIKNITVSNGVDYIYNQYFTDHLNNGQGRPVKDYLLTKHLAVALCINTKTRVAKKTKDYLLQNQ